MAESAYHNEALRRQRIIERKRDAQVRLLEGPQSNEMPGYGGADMKDTVLYSGPGHFEQSRITRQVRKKEEHLLRSINGGVQRIYHRRIDNNPEDKVYPLIHPKERPPKHTELPPRKPHLKV
ncbi:uncharacterized protein LOC127707419 isoform X11 [Mytilus californianus]|uniref:uncharacterized protein LOC127707419 isoform X11 n=1 Tax=Mytilus californianus TaxID=6549 RepID=UPI0022464826|nr:uncharacterized protein LOC127707419 isoform X11 [Mytilus californianus]